MGIASIHKVFFAFFLNVLTLRGRGWVKAKVFASYSCTCCRRIARSVGVLCCHGLSVHGRESGNIVPKSFNIGGNEVSRLVYIVTCRVSALSLGERRVIVQLLNSAVGNLTQVVVG